MDGWMDIFSVTEQGATDNDSTCNSFSYNSYVSPTLYFLMFPVALLLNSVAAYVSFHLKSTSTFIVYLKHLVASDLVITLIVPMMGAGDLPHKDNVVFMLSCRYFSTVFYSALYTCITFLGLISLDRFFKIMMPHSKVSNNVTISKVVSGLTWVLMYGSTALPNIILSNKSVNISEITSCMDLKEDAGLAAHERTVIFVNIYFWIVSLVLAGCYICITNKVIQSFRNSGSNNSQGKQRIKLRVFLVLIVFFVSFGPYHIVRIPYTFQQVSFTSTTSCSYLLGRFAKELSLWFATTNICVNPLLYVFLCREFKEKLKSMMSGLFTSCREAPAGKRDSSLTQTTL